MAKARKVKQYDKRGYPLDPRDVDRNTWFYEERKGLCVVRQIRDAEGNLVSGDMFVLPWRFVLAAAKTRQRLTK